MAGICGIVSRQSCVRDLFLGTFYLQHRIQNFCGIGLSDGERLHAYTHKGLLRQQFPDDVRRALKGASGVGSVSKKRQPISELSILGGRVTVFDGNFTNKAELKDYLLKNGRTFSGYSGPEEISDTVISSKIISMEASFEKGIETLAQLAKGDFAIISMAKEGLYAARGWGRKPLIIGQKEGSYAVASESNSFVNTRFRVLRDVKPGEIVLADGDGVHTLKELDLSPIKYCAFEWIYSAYPPSVIDGKSVAEARKAIGRALAKRHPVDADVVSPVPNSGRWHAIGYAEESGIDYEEAFVRYDYSDRSYTQEGENQQEEADTKLIPLEAIVRGKRVIIVDDSIVRGTQTKNQVKRLRECGAKEVHARIACPPLMCACSYGDSTKRDDECVARRMSIEEIRKTRGLDSLGYATAEDIESAIGIPRERLCLECWTR